MYGDISLNLERKNGTSLEVTARVSQMHPETCAFTASEPLFPDNSAHFADRESGHDSPLVDALFALGNVGSFLVSHDTVKVTLEGDADWDDMIPRVGSAIRDVLDAGKPPIAQAVAETQLSGDEIRRRVAGVLDTVINPAVAAHGGFVNLVDVANNTVYLEFGGGCQGCGMINVTLKYGVERAIRSEVPEVGDILDSTDHASGRNPYYAPSSK